MKFLIGILVVLSFSFVAQAADPDNTTTKKQSADDYFDGGSDGGSFNQRPPTQNRDPSSANDLPYSDDEIQKNTPENYAPKNMPIDQD